MLDSATDVEDPTEKDIVPSTPQPPSRPGRRRRAGYVGGLFLLLVLLLLGAVVVLIAQGSIAIPIGEVIRILTGQKAGSEISRTIVMDARLPKVVAGLLAGSALAVGGVQMQTLFRNPLADPFVLGVSSGAILGASIVILGTGGVGWLAGLGVVSQLGVTGAAVAGAAGVLLIALGIARRVGDPVVVLVVGVMLGYLAGAAVDMLIYYTDPDRLQALTTFTRGSVRNVTWNELWVIALTCGVVLLLSVFLAQPLNALLLGERYAGSLGVNVRRVHFLSLASVAVLSGVTTAYCGAIGFVGLAAPHLARGLLRTADHRLVLPASALIGGVIVLIAEYIAGGNGLTTTTLPLNSVTAFVGAPVILWVLLSGRARREGR
ncbi:iron ABC transporter permease [Streptomyces scopuliridis]|uniref:Iron ABC transporter permease n=1 Tax=Streptomyces scopuliridis TaxID=452529 RepID=A0ACD4ZLC9_9ACTN|nr:iron ABC transporter permease [Streptomyces scopuliridis]WSB34548.1 iron ABC transporter permease [Streptomyces scopuliridis]WSB98793.1 iron ABC transporter permease [Streptomyces scopuliridis]WSC07504.1 iron ABC transporter permease [Streptomyces scopuliridis]